MYSTPNASDAAARGNYLESHYVELNNLQQHKLLEQQKKSNAVKQSMYNDRKITKDQASHMQMMCSGNNQPIMGLHITHAHPSELIHPQSEARRKIQKHNELGQNKGKQMNSTNDTSFTEPITQETDDKQLQCQHQNVKSQFSP